MTGMLAAFVPMVLDSYRKRFREKAMVMPMWMYAEICSIATGDRYGS